MIRGIYTAVSGMIVGEAKQGVINNNISNANTTGFKSENLINKKFDDVLMKNYDKVIGGKNVKNVIGNLSLGTEIDEIVTNYNEGIIRTTDSDTDFAINGNGFFTILKDDGISKNELFTRDGHFHVNSKGYLVNNDGDKVMGSNVETGKNEPIYVGNGKIRLDQLGSIKIDEKEKYKFSIVDFENYKDIKKIGDNYYTCNKTSKLDNYTVIQKKLEKSNVNITDEMVNMMAVMRNFQSNQSVLKSLDNVLDKSVNQLGKVR
jgi:flagellar basal-body rod protein FlgF